MTARGDGHAAGAGPRPVPVALWRPGGWPKHKVLRALGAGFVLVTGPADIVVVPAAVRDDVREVLAARPKAAVIATTAAEETVVALLDAGALHAATDLPLVELVARVRSVARRQEWNGRAR